MADSFSTFNTYGSQSLLNIFRKFVGDDLIVDEVTEKVEKPGQFADMYRPQSSETFMYMWDSDEAVGKKFALTNAFTRSPGKLTKGKV